MIRRLGFLTDDPPNSGGDPARPLGHEECCSDSLIIAVFGYR
jgi:hypothetical protein